MVTHFSANGLDSACGRSSQTLVSTAVADDVSCKSCQRTLAKPDAAGAAVRKSPSLAELRKSAKAAVVPAEPVARPAAAKPAGKVVNTVANNVAEQPAHAGAFSVKAAWAARLAEEGSTSRLPRGKARQRHV
ncbi:hypothetical protein ACQKPE_25450 [Pseudomonas sp. NPDC089554]|uniref:hypothetical protein n=1 Tax=Pseudomonas sp. NPDC089554 TaxID=3390653 RepID=UPI003D06BDBD